MERSSAALPRPLVAAAATLLALGASPAAAPSAAVSGQEPTPVDRWLVAEPADGELPAPETDALARLAGGEFFPDRDEVAGPAYWHLVRRDGEHAFRLEEAIPEGPPEQVLAHAYLRVSADRPVRIAWERPGCGPSALWLNGQRLTGRDATEAAGNVPGGTPPVAPAPAGDSAAPTGDPAAPTDPPGDRPRVDTLSARLAAGWNTLLTASAPRGCESRFGALLLPSPPERGGPANAADPIRVQASSPPGIRRTWPEPYAVATAPILAGRPLWRAGDERLRGRVAVPVVTWGRAEGVGEPDPPEPDSAVEGPDSLVAAPDSAEFPDEEAAEPDSARERGARPGRAGAAALRRRLDPPPEPPPPAPGAVEVQLEVAGEDVERVVRGLEPARPSPVTSDPVEFRRIREAALEPEGVEAELEWEDGESERSFRLSPAAVLAWLHGPIELLGWAGAGAGADVAGPDRARAGERGREGGGEPLVEAGARVSGTWRVPPTLTGFTLRLETASAPGRYIVNGEPARAVAGAAGPPGPSGEGGAFLLCGPCPEGRELRIEAEATADWSAFPTVRIGEGGHPAAGGRGPEAEAWLEALEGGEDNRAYLELSRAHGSGG